MSNLLSIRSSFQIWLKGRIDFGVLRFGRLLASLERVARTSILRLSGAVACATGTAASVVAIAVAVAIAVTTDAAHVYWIPGWFNGSILLSLCTNRLPSMVIVIPG